MLQAMLLLSLLFVGCWAQEEHVPLGSMPKLSNRELKQELSGPVVINGKPVNIIDSQYFTEVQKRVKGWKQCVGLDKGGDVEDEDFTIEDLLIPVEEADNMVTNCRRGVGRPSRDKRQIVFPNKFWGKTIPIVFTDHALGTTAPAFIAEMIEDFNKYTCIRFNVVATQPDEPHVVIITDKSRSGCYTYAGQNAGINDRSIPARYRGSNTHPVFLGSGCLWYEVVVHEMLHVIGLYHEQSRMDRDGSITIHWDNIDSSWHSQFRTCENDPCELASTSYDLHSVMHYGRTAATSNSSQPGMSAVNAALNSALGTSHDITHSDFERIATAYCQAEYAAQSCGAQDCTSGYPDPNQCGCVCADGFGPSCTAPDPIPSPHCGGLIQTTDAWQEIVFQTTRHEPESDQCVYVVEAPADGFVELETRALTTHASTNVVQPCQYVALEVKTQSDALQEEAPGLCGEIGDMTFYSTGRRLMVTYRYSYTAVRDPVSVYVRTYGATGPPPTTTTTTAATTTTTTTTTTTPAPATCAPGKWGCANGFQCIKDKLRCNGKINCWDGSDEDGC